MDGMDGVFDGSEDVGEVVEVAEDLAKLGKWNGKRPLPPPPYTHQQPYTQQYTPAPPHFHPNTMYNQEPSEVNGYPFHPNTFPYPYQPAMYHQPQQLGSSSTRALHVYHPHGNPAKATIFDADKTTPLYTVKIRMLKPHLIVAAASSPAPIATALFHDFRSHIDVVVRGTPLTLHSRGIAKSGHSYISPALGGQEVVWKRESMVGKDMRCEDGKGSLLARFKFNSWAWKKCGTLEVMAAGADGGRAMEEIVVTGMMMMEHNVCTRAQGVAAAVGAV
ncbi:MAG: hypothetical protein LQ349_004896 [Xanthoria aureola]|nr:MAG: hypothetical protein LQ349_004896 [Xanthoria aureola]